MKIRLHGLMEECADAASRIGTVTDVLDVSSPYPDRPPSRLVRVYMEVRLAPPRGYGEDKDDAR